MPEPRPTLTLTLRRTGGTSLQSFLAQISPFRSVEHEPFNPDRMWGHVVKKFQDGRDLVALEADIDALLEAEVNVKHCIEVVPPEVTKTLIKCAKKRGYFFIVLTRRDSVRRLRSLFMAMSTGAWGPEQEEARYPGILSGEFKATPVNLEKVKRQYWNDQLMLGRMLSVLRYQNVSYQWLVFEEIYKGEQPVSVHAANLARQIGIDVSGEGDNLDKLNEKGKQSSHHIEDFVPNYDAMMATLKEVCID
ncbi:hypothetical protein [Pseudophaeobacter sp.]|uniref:hypothetical protein n=1 Tax=Pseudophaeobacter sp. TaxID=1971739 RepID=UPI003A974E90